jgi:arabinofuranosyltransferase
MTSQSLAPAENSGGRKQEAGSRRQEQRACRLPPAYRLLNSTGRATVVIVLVYIAYAALFIYKQSVVVDGTRYFSLFDDAMISMRYARNLAAGNGLVWNVGERVQGFTTPLWALYMSLVHLLPLPVSKISLVLSLTGALLQIITAVYAKKIADLLFPELRAPGILAAAFCAFYLPLNFWALEGMEVGLLAALIAVSAFLLLRAMGDVRPETEPRPERAAGFCGSREGAVVAPLSGTAPSRPAQSRRGDRRASVAALFGPQAELACWLLAAGTLVRVDAAVPLAAALLFFAATSGPAGRSRAMRGALIAAVLLALQFAAAFSYYGRFLPNTYYLKVEGFPLAVRLARGLYLLAGFILRLGIPLFLAPWFFSGRRGDRRVWLLAALFGAQLLYSVYVGGDAWESKVSCNRYIAVVMPLFFVLISYPLYWFAGRIVEALAPTKAAFARRPAMVLLLALSIGLLSFNAAGSIEWLAQWALLRDLPFAVEDRALIATGVLLHEVTTADARIAATAAGALPYFADRYSIDTLGKCDPVIAHEPPRVGTRLSEALDFVPGHAKWDYAYTLGVLKPDLVVGLGGKQEEAVPYLRDYGLLLERPAMVAVRKNSTVVLWEKLAERRAALGAE